MWVSKLVLDSRLREVRWAIANPYALHQALSWAVRDGLERKEERLLWRLEPTRSMDRPVVLLQTWSRPDWNEVLARWPHFAEIHGPKPFNPVLSPGQRLRFRLRANPAKRDAAIRKRVALKTPVEKVRGLEDRLRAGGSGYPSETGNGRCVSYKTFSSEPSSRDTRFGCRPCCSRA